MPTCWHDCAEAFRFLRRVQSDRARGAQQLLSGVLRVAEKKRNALCALYAFMRLVDDVSDEAGDLESKRSGPGRAGARMLDEAVAGRTDGHAILPALADTISRFEIPHALFSRFDSGRGDGSDGYVVRDV